MERYAKMLPWSAEPMPGGEADRQPHSGYRSAKPDGPGSTDEQRERLAAYRAQLLELSITVMTHPYWKGLSENVVAARVVTTLAGLCDRVASGPLVCQESGRASVWSLHEPPGQPAGRGGKRWPFTSVLQWWPAPQSHS
ncbi:hypothetical protein [Streptomyces sp. NBC_01358]|uniref:hypothetical protein n=1 Tax=Streptomyces sp. NBC_01358 TaxID=2903837 RepID=UPI002E3383E1|nr:hypothetical protein [Streptomyces sp. NBC_01358]